MQHDEFPLVVFSIIVNNFIFDTETAENGIDEIVLLLPSLRKC